MITLSVVIPCFNSGELLIEMLDCCKAQTYHNWEVIVVDDGSNDNTYQVIQQYSNEEKRVKVYQRTIEPKGANSCRNIGFNHSVGKYVIFFDADDLISETCFEERIAFMETNTNCDYATFPAKNFSDKTNLPTYETPGKIWGKFKNNCDLLKEFLSVNYPFTVWTNIYRREAIKHIKWNEQVKIYQDFCFIIDGILSGLKHQFSPTKKVDYFYRVVANQNNMCSNFVSTERCESTIYLFNYITDELHRTGKFKYYKKNFIHFIILQYERLVMDGDKTKIMHFIDSCTKPYNIQSRLKFVYNIVLRIKSKKVKRGMMYLSFIVLFGYTSYIKTIFKSL